MSRGSANGAATMNRHLQRLVGALAVLVAIGIGGVFVVTSGIYNVAANEQHLRPTFWLIQFALRRAVEHRAAGIEVPPLADERVVQRGLAHFRVHCVACHGAPGVAPQSFAFGMTPAPANLVDAAREWKPAELYWVIREGIKMTGMPAWQFHLADDDIWAVVAFMQRLPALSPAQYRSLPDVPVPAHAEAAASAAGPAPVDLPRAKQAIDHYLCLTCHRIPGLVGPHAPVGPSLEGIGARGVIAGRLPNTPANMQRLLREPHRIKPDGAMPDLGVSERDARDIAAYLATLK